MQPTLFSLLAIHLFRSLIRGLIETNSSRLRQSSFLHVQDQSDIVVCQLRWDSFLRIWRQRVNVENSVERRTTKRSCHDWFARNQEPVNRKRSATHHFGEVHDSGRVIEKRRPEGSFGTVSRIAHLTTTSFTKMRWLNCEDLSSLGTQ
jgi:hypothetical protein